MRYVLVHMSCAGAWAWGEVPERLRAAGHVVLAPDLDLSPGETPTTHADAVAAAAGPGDGELVLAGHSYGGMVVPVLADRLRGRVRAFVVIDGLMPDPGDSAATLRPESAAARRDAARETGLWWPEVDDPAPDWAARLAGMPISAWEAPVDFTPLDVPRTFVLCRRDPMADQAARAQARGWTVVEVDEYHELPLRNPELCTRLLLDAL